VVRELELEILSGDLIDLLALARQWRDRCGLWLQSASKAARGYRLAAGAPHGPAPTATVPDWSHKPRLGEFTASVLEACLAQVIDNASELASGSRGDDHIHQLRVGIRRLRTALRELPGLDTARKRHEGGLVTAFRALGARRDRTHVLGQVRAAIEAAGGQPLLPVDGDDGADAANAVRSAGFQDALLALLMRAAECRAHTGKRVKRAVEPRLAKLHAQVEKDGRRFDRLTEPQQHRVRKRLKRLRYLAEFVAPLYGGRATRRFLGAVKPAQEALGRFNDERVAQALYEEAARGDPDARFGADWLAGRHEAQVQACRKALRNLAKAKRFWS
jgi:triphosphatase